MDNDVDAVVLACRGTLASWSLAVEAVAYEQARVNAESPLDRGAALRRRVEDLSMAADATPSLAAGFDRLAAERGWRRGMTGSECRSRVVALARPYADVPAALEAAVGAGLPLVVVSPGDPVLVEGALRPLDGAFDAILTARELGAAGPGAVLTAAARWMAADPRRLLYVSASRVGIVHAGMLGMRRAWVNRTSDGEAPAAAPARRGVAQPARAGSVPGRGLSDASGRGLMGASGMIEVVAFACRGTLVDWAGAIEAVAYELARRNGESPLDRGAMLRRRVEALADGHGLSRGFERLARERRYRVGKDGDELLANVVATGAAAAGGARGRGAGARVRPACARRVTR